MTDPDPSPDPTSDPDTAEDTERDMERADTANGEGPPPSEED